MENKTLDKVTNFAMKIAKPMNKFASIDGVKAVTIGLMNAMPLTMIGSIFILLFVFSTPGQMGIENFALFPFLAGFAPKFLTVFLMTLNFLGFWCSLTIAQAYAELKQFDTKIAGIVGVLTFLLLATQGPVNGAISVGNFGATGLFVAMLGSVWMTKLYIFLDKKNIKLRLPSSVPSYVGKSFGAIVPMLLVAVVSWIIRSVLNLDLVALINLVLSPLVVNAENPFVYSLFGILGNLLWFCGLHGAALTSPITAPLTTLYLTENAAAKAAGTMILPHIWIPYTLGAALFVGGFWVLTVLLLTSKAKHLKAIGRVAALPIIFNVQEPLVFGLPLVFNGYLIIPWILSTVVNGLIAWYLSYFNIIGRGFVDPSWATPSFLTLPFSTGDIKSLMLIPICFTVGMIIWFPFFKAFEKAEMAKMDKS